MKVLRRPPSNKKGKRGEGGSDLSFPDGGHAHRGLENIAIHKAKIFAELEVLQFSGFVSGFFSCRELILLKSHVAIVWMIQI